MKDLQRKTIAGYEVVGKIGEGGMGEVYRARDKELGRDVAIKVLPEGFATDDERLRRFQQEAQAVGALNHPNILVIYHIGTDDGAPYIVSELLEGETLRDKIAGSPVPQRKAIDYALQIAHGLAAAHEKGIVHRDLKPENIFITKDGRAKILDFGLAKLTQPDAGKAQTEIPTRRIDTDPGTIMGTVSYMSPEQIRARPLDHRTDIFSFGAILYEMLTGKQAFHGESTADLMSSILREDPAPLASTNTTVAPALQRIIDHCLEKNPEERFHSASDLAFAIEALSGTTSISAAAAAADLPGRRRAFRDIIGWIGTAVFLIGMLIFAALYFTRPATEVRRIAFAMEMPEKATETYTPFISPDGRYIAFAASVDGKRSLYLRNLGTADAQKISDTDEATDAMWSPDGRYLAFFAGGKLKKIDIGGGPAQIICDAPNATGGSWNRDGVIIFGMQNKPLQRVSASGGLPSTVIPLDASRKEIDQECPYFLPDGKHFLYYSWNGNASESELWVASLDGSDRKSILRNDSNAAYISGYVLFARSTTLVAQAFDVGTLAVTGDAFPVLENVNFSNLSFSSFSVSGNGSIAYWRSSSSGRQLSWFDRAGKQLGRVGPPSNFNDVVLSPDDKHAALQLTSEGNSDIWVMDVERGVPLRLTFAANSEDNPSWSRDGAYLYYTSSAVGGGGVTNFMRKMSSGAGGEEPLGQMNDSSDNGIDLTPDGRSLLFEVLSEKTSGDIWVMPLTGGPPQPLLDSPFVEQHAKVSPDGHWFAYVSNETGHEQIYVQSFPLGSGKWQVSTAGGSQPRWRRDGKELFYMAPDRMLMALDVKLGTTFEMGTPTPLFHTQVENFNAPNRYDVSRDGQRFLINSPVQETSRAPIVVITNWAGGLKK